MNNFLLDCQSYILNENNMQTYLEHKLVLPNENMKKTETRTTPKTHSVYIPNGNDSLFWCYYIIKNGDIQYEMLQHRNALVSKQHKINLVSKIRENKQIVKTYKFDSISNIENNLANENSMNIKTFMTICAIDNINIIFVSKKFYFEMLTNDTDVIYIVRLIDSSKLKYTTQYGYEIANEELLTDIRCNFYKVESLDKPIKTLSSYKVTDLITIANKLAIELVNKETGKKKTKNELYESLIQYF